jgi:ATPase family associated with various cellular activities (AAA)/Winged helix domain, variant
VNAAGDWTEANQRDLMCALDRVRLLLEAHAARGRVAPDSTSASAEPAAAEDPGPLALAALVRLFGLSAFERDVVLLCAGIELDARFAAAVAAAQGAPPERPEPTFALALAVLPDAHWSALTPAAPLRAWRLVELRGAGLTGAPLRLEERILHFLTGLNQLDERLQGLVTLGARGGERDPPHPDTAARLASYLGREGTVAQVVDGDAVARETLAAAAGAALDRGLLRLRAADVPAPAAERVALARLVAREAVLGRAIVLVDSEGTPEDAARVTPFVRALGVPTVVAGPEAVAGLAGFAPVFDLPPPTREAQAATWRRALGPLANRLNGALPPILAQFRLSTEAINAVAGDVSASDDAEPAALWDRCRRAARPAIQDLAQRVEPAASWDDLVLPAPQLATLREIAVHVRRRAQVYDDWGFSTRGTRGLGISALFAGPSGTGKTMAAEVLAGDLRLDLHRIDLATVVSKYIGETEKNLRRVFDAAESGGAILLFDEADALFGKRSEVRDSHDRYANIEVSYLLQRMEAYRGLAILTTNQKSALDPAFLRRIRFVVQFPFPDAAHRAAIWQRIFPAATPTAPLEYERLGQLAVSGGHIRNIALHGAFLAADRGEPVGMHHLLEAARGEYAKLERPLTDAESRGWR